ncbi:flagellar assembly factor FliW [Bacillus pakistanensis]|uniref:Flagellar assembly factor FliW n=1 Tax=Rossellomorea pakistanensis TaxID=992288 RepID=A0ABS2NDC6_9BACI|nr:flagellar assembly protein FliW [Bacillus pakistanensis]MBM7585873.1 flagellar assembly factor FliW [Bacillus pakistanensis]
MKIQTSYHGEILIEERDRLVFKNGIPGFGDETSFMLLPVPENPIFQVLQSTNTPGLAFIVTNPFHFFEGYDFTLETGTLDQLGIQQESDVLVYTILTLKNPFENSTANLQAPIVINQKNNHGKQVILNHPDYKTRHLFVESQTASMKG